MKSNGINIEREYENLLEWIDIQFDNKVKPDSPNGKKLQFALLLIEAYENIQYPIPNLKKL